MARRLNMMMQRKSALIPLLALILCVTAAILFSAEPASAASVVACAG